VTGSDNPLLEKPMIEAISVWKRQTVGHTDCMRRDRQHS
jgi:hypothetical protein